MVLGMKSIKKKKVGVNPLWNKLKFLYEYKTTKDFQCLFFGFLGILFLVFFLIFSFYLFYTLWSFYGTVEWKRRKKKKKEICEEIPNALRIHIQMKDSNRSGERWLIIPVFQRKTDQTIDTKFSASSFKSNCEIVFFLNNCVK